MLQINGLTVSFKHEELFKDLNLHVKNGEIVCIKGRSGSGKTTLLRAIMGFVPIKEGSIVVDGILLTAHSAEAIRKKIAWMPQELALPVEWVSDMVKIPFGLKANRGVEFSEKKLLENFSQLELEEDLLGKRVCEISGGQRQRIMLAVSGMLNKKLIIVDEPTAALDNVSSYNALNFMRRLLNNGTSILTVSHDPCFIEGATRVFSL